MLMLAVSATSIRPSSSGVTAYVPRTSCGPCLSIWSKLMMSCMLRARAHLARHLGFTPKPLPDLNLFRLDPYPQFLRRTADRIGRFDRSGFAEGRDPAFQVASGAIEPRCGNPEAEVAVELLE